MLPISPYDVKRMVDRRAEEAIRRRDQQRLLQEARTAQRGSAPPLSDGMLGWLGRLVAWLGSRRQPNCSPGSLPLDPRSADRR